MIESGVISNILTKYQVTPPEGCLGNGLDALDLQNVLGIFVILIGSFAFTLVIFALECLIKYVGFSLDFQYFSISSF